MATTVQTLTNYLDQRGWTYQTDWATQQILTGVKASPKNAFLISLNLSENGKTLRFIVPQLLNLKDNLCKGLVFQAVLRLQWELKLIRFQYNPDDGELRVSLDLPLRDNPLTPELFETCLQGLIWALDAVAMPQIQQVLKTGEDPGHQGIAGAIANSIPTDQRDMYLAIADQLRRLS